MIILLVWHTSPWLSCLSDTLHHDYPACLTHFTMIILLAWHTSPWLSYLTDTLHHDYPTWLTRFTMIIQLLLRPFWMSTHIMPFLLSTKMVVLCRGRTGRHNMHSLKNSTSNKITYHNIWTSTLVAFNTKSANKYKFMFNVKTTTKRLFTGLINGGGNTKCWGTWEITSSNKGINLNRLFMSKTIPKSDLQTRSKHSKAQVNWTQKSTEHLTLTDV